jgi:hypothetical protein
MNVGKEGAKPSTTQLDMSKVTSRSDINLDESFITSPKSKNVKERRAVFQSFKSPTSKFA